MVWMFKLDTDRIFLITVQVLKIFCSNSFIIKEEKYETSLNFLLRIWRECSELNFLLKINFNK